MNKLFKTAVILLIPGGMLFGQQANTGNPIMQQAQQKTAQMNRELALTGDEIPKIFQINVDYLNQMDSYNKMSANFTAEEKQETLKQINDKYTEALKNVFTIAQNEQYKKMQADK